MKLWEVNAFSHVGPSVSHSVHKGANVTITHDPDALDLTVQTPLTPATRPWPTPLDMVPYCTKAAEPQFQSQS